MNYIESNLIRLYRINHVFQFWYGPCSFSKIVFDGKLPCCVCLTQICICLHFFESKKTRIHILRRPVQLTAREIRSETIPYIFGWCPYHYNPRLTWSLLIISPNALHVITFYSILHHLYTICIPTVCNYMIFQLESCVCGVCGAHNILEHTVAIM